MSDWLDDVEKRADRASFSSRPQDQAASSADVPALIKRIAWLEAALDEAGKALAVYADPNNWGRSDDGWINWEPGGGSIRDAMKVATKARAAALRAKEEKTDGR
jgi:hypothetical protein